MSFAPKYGEVRDRIRQHIVLGRYAAGNRLPSREEFLLEFGVGDSTLQRALDELANDGFIEARGRHGTYVSALPPHLTNIGIVFPHTTPHSSLFHEALRQASRDVVAAPLRLCEYVVPYEANPRADRDRFCDDVLSQRLGGIIYPTLPLPLEDRPDVVGARIPRVVIGSRGGEFPAVRIRTGQTLPRALDYLAARGCRRIAHLLYDHANAGHDLPQATAARQLELRPYWVQMLAPPKDSRAGEHVVHLLMRLSGDDRPDALIIHDDNLVAPALAGLRAAGVQPGRDLQVVAHTNFPVIPCPEAPVVRLGFDCHAIVRACVSSLLAQRRQEVPEPVDVGAVFAWEREDLALSTSLNEGADHACTCSSFTGGLVGKHPAAGGTAVLEPGE